MDSQLIIRHVVFSLDFKHDKEGSMTSIPVTHICFTAETSIPFSSRFQATMTISESYLKELSKDLDALPIEFLKRLSNISRGFEDIHRKHFYACYDNEEEIYEQILELFKEGAHAYFNGSYALWQKHLCCVHDLRVGETVTLGNGFTFKVKQPARIISEPHDDPWGDN